MANRKDYEAVAAILRREHQKLDDGVTCDPRTSLNIIGNKIASYFLADNANFSMEKFGNAIHAHDIPEEHHG